MFMKKTVYYIVLALLIIVCGATAYGAYYYYDKYQKIDKERLELIDKKSMLENDLKALMESAEEDKTTDGVKEEADNEKSAGVDTSDWVTYTNTKYGFSFKHPADYTIDGCPTKPCSEFIGEESGGDNTIMQGDISEVGWPNTAVMHLSSEYYNPPAGTDLREWIVTNFSYYDEYLSLSPNYTITTSEGGTYVGYDYTVPSSPQSYSQRYINFVNDDDEMFVIQMYDYESYSSDFYDAWLETFIF